MSGSKYPAPIPSVSTLLRGPTNGALTQSIGDVTLSAAGGAGVSGQLTASIGEVTSSSQVGAGTVGRMTQTLGVVSINADGFLYDRSGELTKTLAAVTLSSAGTVQGFAGSKWPAFLPSISLALEKRGVATVAKTLGAVTLASAGSVTSAGKGQSKNTAPLPAMMSLFERVTGEVLGWVNKPIGTVTLSSAVDVPPWTDPPIDFYDQPEPGAVYYAWTQDTTWFPSETTNRDSAGGGEAGLDQVIGAVTLASAVGVDVVGSLDKTLDVTSTTAVGVRVDGALSTSVGAITCSGVADVDSNFVATLAKTLPGFGIVAAGGPVADGRVAATLAAVTAVGRIDTSGGDFIASLDKTVGQIRLSVTGGPSVLGSLVQPTREVALYGKASVLDGFVVALNQPIGDIVIASAAQVIQVELGVRRRTKVLAGERRIGSALVRVSERRIEGVPVE